LARTIRQDSEVEGIQTVTEEVKLSLFANDMNLFTEKHEQSTKKIIVLISKFHKVVRFKIDKQNLVGFFIYHQQN
jgi:hypothetical protein